MEFEKYKADLLEYAQKSRHFFSNDNKLNREKWVVSKLLDTLSVKYSVGDLKDAEEPADVGFRCSQFQIKEVMVPDGRPRGRDLQDDIIFADNATCFEDFLEPYRPCEINVQCIINRCLSRAEKLLLKYPPEEISKMDLLCYFNATDYLEIKSDFELPNNLQYRSVSIVSNQFRIVVYASMSASEFLQKNVGNLYSAGDSTQGI